MRNRRSSHKITDSFAGLPRPTGSREPPNSPNSPKSGAVLWGKKSLHPPFVVSGRWTSVAANLRKKPCLTASRSYSAFNGLSSASNLVWRTKDERYDPACLKRSVKLPTSGLCINKRYGQYYLPQINSYIHRGDDDMIFQQHLAPAHSEKDQDTTTGAKHSSTQLVSQQSRPKHY